MTQVLRFTTNVPEEVTLRSTSGKRVEGRYGDQIMYSLFDDRTMYVPLVVGDRIRELDIASGEPFEICKAEARDGNRKWIEWRVRKFDDQPRASQPTQGSTPSQAQRTTPAVNGRAHPPQTEFKAEPDGTILPVPITGRGVTVMEVAMNAAAEVAQRVESRAALRNYSLRFTSEDIRAIGLTMFIQASREGGVRWEA